MEVMTKTGGRDEERRERIRERTDTKGGRERRQRSEKKERTRATEEEREESGRSCRLPFSDSALTMPL